MFNSAANIYGVFFHLSCRASQDKLRTTHTTFRSCLASLKLSSIAVCYKCFMQLLTWFTSSTLIVPVISMESVLLPFNGPATNHSVCKNTFTLFPLFYNTLSKNNLYLVWLYMFGVPEKPKTKKLNSHQTG